MSQSCAARRPSARVRSWFAAAIVLAAQFVVPSHVLAGRPNVLVILTDDQGWGDLSIHGNTDLSTPHIDSLAREGASFDRFFVQPVCAPTRAEFLTGRYHPRGGVRGVSTGQERLDLDERTIAEAFGAAGYATACFGKWHNGSQYPYHPNGRGFDEFYGFTHGHWGDYFDPPLDHNGEDVQGEGYLPDDLTARAITFMQKSNSSQQPFFCYVAYNTPHSPMQVPQRYWDRFAAAKLSLQATQPEHQDVAHTRAALAMCENIDDNVGRMLEALADMQIESDTIVAFFSDNGPNGHRFNGGMKGVKGSTDEGGVRSPLFVRWSGRIPAGQTIEPIAAAIDLYPTLAALARVPVVKSEPLDGEDLSDILLGGEGAPADRVLVQHWVGRTSARSQTHRLDDEGRLFDMQNDAAQSQDASGEQPAVAKSMQQAVKRWRREVLGELPQRDDRPFPVGHAKRRAATLPARDGEPHGGVERSARAPNCSFFTNWTTVEDRMTWDVEVLTPGLYEATVAYTCPADSIGSSIELSFAESRWTGTIDAAHDPPLKGAELDRVPRTSESYVKAFRTLSLGTAQLRAGRATLTLQAKTVAGDVVADVESVTLRLK